MLKCILLEEVLTLQKLMFESSWDKALSSKDRKDIEAIFLETNENNLENIRLSPIWNAVNHRGELLITVLVHNFTQKTLTFNEKRLVYIENDEIVAESSFTLTTLVIPSKVSMPWTFIFPVECLKKPTEFENGHLEIK